MSKRDGKKGHALTDRHLWADVKRTVTPLRPWEVDDEPLPIPAAASAAPAKTAPARSFALPGYQATGTPGRPPMEAGRVIEPRMRRRLVRGRIDIDATIDLHGMRQHEARQALGRFVAARVARGDRTLLVITGKGFSRQGETALAERGVLRAMLPIWLSEPALAPHIAGWDVSAQGHGGEGAFYVRLRRTTP